MLTLQIHSRIMGHYTTDWDVPSVRLTLPQGQVTVRELIMALVETQIQSWVVDHRWHLPCAIRVLQHHIIPEPQPPLSFVTPTASFDADLLLQLAYEAFEDGLYLVVIDGYQPTNLDEELFLHAHSKVSCVYVARLARSA